MKIAQIYALVGALILSSTALAEGGGDRTFSRATQATEQAMEKQRNSTRILRIMEETCIINKIVNRNGTEKL